MKQSCAYTLIILLVAGCAASRIQVVEPKKAGFENYSVLEITDLKNNIGPKVPAEVLQRVPDAIAEKVRGLSLYQAVNRVPAVTEAAPETNTLILEGTIIEYEPGSRALRYLVGFGAGKAYATVQLKAIDKAKKEEIFRGNIAAEQSMGVFGGSFDGVIQKLVDESVECIQMNYSAGERISPLPQKVKSSIISQEQQVAAIPKGVEKPIIPIGKLRDTPKGLMEYDIRRMIEKYNFYDKNLNELGDFPNDLVDNGDGTITDRATGLMWEKRGSSSQPYYGKAKKYVERLNQDSFSGYNNWRIPTLEELWSLLEPGVNERGQHISSVFEGKQSKCLTIDPFEKYPTAKLCGTLTIVDFAEGEIDETATENILLRRECKSVRYFIRAVRTIK